MTYRQLEQDIITQLEPIFGRGISTISFPEKRNEVAKRNKQGWIQLEWINSVWVDYSVREEIAEITVTYNLDVFATELRESDRSLYEVINLAVNRLWGFRPSVSHRAISIVETETQRFDAEWWIGRITINAYLLQQAPNLTDDRSQDPLAKDIIFNTQLPQL